LLAEASSTVLGGWSQNARKTDAITPADRNEAAGAETHVVSISGDAGFVSVRHGAYRHDTDQDVDGKDGLAGQPLGRVLIDWRA
jgi:hypothetical protein